MPVTTQPDRRQSKRLATSLRPFEIKSVDTAAHTFEGLAATWDLDLGGDVIHKGAFAKTLTFWREKGFSIPLIDLHNYGSINDVLGSMIDAEEQDAGLWAKFEVDDGADGQKLLRHIERKRLNGLSIGYEPVAPEFDDAGIRHLREVKLAEVSPVIWPMNPGAVFDPSSVKGYVPELTDDVIGELRAALDAEATARAEKANPMLSEEKADLLRARLLSIRLRSLSRTAGEYTRNTH